MRSYFLKISLFLSILPCIAYAKGQRWQIYDTMPYPVAGAQVVVHEDKIYIFGGYEELNGPPTDMIQVYDPSACLEERWRVGGAMQIARANFVARIYKDTVYIVGGTTGYKKENVPSMEVWRFDNTGKSLPDDWALNRIGSTGEIWRDYFIIIGGYTNSRPEYNFGYLAAYHLGSDVSIGQIPGFSGLEPYNQASALLGDVIFIFGGVRSGISNRIYRIDLEVLDWQHDPPIAGGIPRLHPDLPFPRSAMATIVTEPDTVWLIGGYNEDQRALASTSKFVITKHGYGHKEGPPLNEARKELMAAQIDTVMYVFGGTGEHDQVVESVEALIDTVIFDPCENSAVKKNDDAEFAYTLRRNYPNPFNASTTIEIELTATSQIRLEICSSLGRLIKTLVQDELSPGHYRYIWDGTSDQGMHVTSGVYLCKLITATEEHSCKMLLVK
ncbi:T9SS type A sorting domain-containing protein [candidate division KSB1 bacterium]|nr:T9SS type A sorting domain-containing protein [candidate division KSB1 bacterium]